jgi:hypothetical protein
MDAHRPRQEAETVRAIPRLHAEILEIIFGNLTSNLSDVKSICNSSVGFYHLARPIWWREPEFRHNLDLETLKQIVKSSAVKPPIKVLKLSQFDQHIFCNNPDSEIEELVVFLLKQFQLSSFHMDARLDCRDARYEDCRHGFITNLTQVKCFVQLPVDRIYTCLLAESELIEHPVYPYLRHAFPVKEFMDLLLDLDPCPKLVLDHFFYSRLELEEDYLKLSTLPTCRFSWVMGSIVVTNIDPYFDP